MSSPTASATHRHNRQSWSFNIEFTNPKLRVRHTQVQKKIIQQLEFGILILSIWVVWTIELREKKIKKRKKNKVREWRDILKESAMSFFAFLPYFFP
jgi:hypothetical protein